MQQTGTEFNWGKFKSSAKAYTTSPHQQLLLVFRDVTHQADSGPLANVWLSVSVCHPRFCGAGMILAGGKSIELVEAAVDREAAPLIGCSATSLHSE